MSLDKLISTVAEALAPSVTDQARTGRSAVAIKADTPAELLGTLTALGLGAADKLTAAGHKVSVAEIDAAMSSAKVELQDRIRLKNAMARSGMLKA